MAMRVLAWVATVVLLAWVSSLDLTSAGETGTVQPCTAVAPASEVEAVVRSPTNMAAAKIAAVDFDEMTSK